ncbi:MAG: site-specific integrase [Edaphobacter sp.]|nr:site-specific integrase [Edaphobacter sp.]
MQRVSYQQGSVVKKPRAKGPDVWVLRYMDGDVQRSDILGTIHEFETKAAARKKAAERLKEINERLAGIKVSGLCDRLKLEWEKPKDIRPKTAKTYIGFMKRMRADWGNWRVDDMVNDILAVEKWINDYEVLAKPDRIVPDRFAKGKLIPGKTIPGKPARPASKKTKLHIKAFVHLVFEHAMKWKLIPMLRNPMTLFRVKGRRKRVRKPNIITRDQWIALTTDPELSSHVRTMIFIAMLLGLRVSEILGLRWEDFDMVRRVMSIHRSQVGQNTGDTKTEGSEEELPIHPDLYEVLEAWREEQTIDGETRDGVHTPVNGWLFGNLITGRPFWGGTLQQDHLVPAGRKVGIPNLGWHCFRHTYRAMMDEEKLTLEEQRVLMRHEDIRTTLGYGGKSKAETVRGANAKVVEMLRKHA